MSVNGGLYSPCMTRTKRMGVEASYCTSCSKGTPTKMELYGTVTDRKSNGASLKSSISFGTYCAKRGVNREWVEEWVSKNLDGLIIPEKEWEVDDKKSKFAVPAVAVEEFVDNASAGRLNKVRKQAMLSRTNEFIQQLEQRFYEAYLTLYLEKSDEV